MWWAIFRQRQAEHGEIHVIPAYPSGLILEPHVVDVLCPCEPLMGDREDSNDPIAVIHSDIHT